MDDSTCAPRPEAEFPQGCNQDFGPALDQIEIFDLCRASDALLTNREIVLGLLSQGKSDQLFILGNHSDSLEIAVALLRATKKYREHLALMLEYTEIAELRVRVVLGELTRAQSSGSEPST